MQQVVAAPARAPAFQRTHIDVQVPTPHTSFLKVGGSTHLSSFAEEDTPKPDAASAEAPKADAAADAKPASEGGVAAGGAVAPAPAPKPAAKVDAGGHNNETFSGIKTDKDHFEVRANEGTTLDADSSGKTPIKLNSFPELEC